MRTSTKRTVKDQSGAGKLKIGELLSKAGYITSSQFDEAKALQRRTGMRISRILLENGAIESDTIPNFLSRMHNFAPVSLSDAEPSPEALAKLPYEEAKQYLAFPLRISGNTIQITMVEPTDSMEVRPSCSSARSSSALRGRAGAPGSGAVRPAASQGDELGDTLGDALGVTTAGTATGVAPVQPAGCI